MGMTWKLFVICAILAVLAFCLVVIYIQEYRRHRKIQKQLREELAGNRVQLQKTEEIYERFLPGELCRLAGCRRAEDLLPGRQRSFLSSVMSVSAADVSVAVTTPKQQPAAAEPGLSCFLAVAMENGGVVSRLEKAGMTALYPEDAPGALAAAIRMCEAMDSAKETVGGFAIGLDYGTVRLRITGNEKRLSMITISESENSAEFLQKKAAKYGTRILAAAGFAGQIADFEKRCSSRLLGYFYDRTQEEAVKIYDIYDGDPVERRQAKRRTRMIFEQGVDRFVHGFYEEARRCFVEVLKADRQDLAAREYLYRCDRFCQEPKTEADVCMEAF